MDNCNIIRDILPLYAENLVSDDTRAFVEEHLGRCPSCREEFSKMKSPVKIVPDTDPAPLEGLKRKLRLKRVWTAVLTASLALVLALSVFAALSSPQFIPYGDGLLEVRETPDGGLSILFDDAVTGYSALEATDAETGKQDCYLEAWTTLWDRLWGGRGRQNMVVAPEDVPENVYYAQNNGEEDVLVYGPAAADSGIVSLPRLSLSFYFLMALILFFILILAWQLLHMLQQKLRQKQPQKYETAARWLGRAVPAPLCYMLSHLCVKGVRFATYSPQRDLTCILLVAFFLYCAALAGIELCRGSQKEKQDK